MYIRLFHEDKSKWVSLMITVCMCICKYFFQNSKPFDQTFFFYLSFFVFFSFDLIVIFFVLEVTNLHYSILYSFCGYLFIFKCGSNYDHVVQITTTIILPVITSICQQYLNENHAPWDRNWVTSFCRCLAVVQCCFPFFNIIVY